MYYCMTVPNIMKDLLQWARIRRYTAYGHAYELFIMSALINRHASATHLVKLV